MPVSDVPGRTVVEVSASVDAATFTELLLTLSAPRQLVAKTGVTE